MISLILMKPWDLLMPRGWLMDLVATHRNHQDGLLLLNQLSVYLVGWRRKKRQTGLRFCNQLSLKLTSQRNTQNIWRKPDSDEATDISQHGHIIYALWSEARHRHKQPSLSKPRWIPESESEPSLISVEKCSVPSPKLEILSFLC